VLPILIFSAKYCIIPCYENLNSMLKVRKITVEFKSVYSNKIKHEILQKIAGSFTQPNFCKNIKSSFKIIKTVEWHLSDVGSVKMLIEGAEPYCRVNNQFVLCNKHRLFTADCFETYKLDRICNIWLSEKMINQKLDADVYNFIRHIHGDKWQDFEIHYLKPSRIELVPKNATCKSLVIVDDKSFFDERKFQMADAAFNDLRCRGFVSEKILNAQNYRIMFDLRFGERVIVKFFDPFKRGVGR